MYFPDFAKVHANVEDVYTQYTINAAKAIVVIQ